MSDSLSLSAYTTMLSSDFFYPSNYNLRQIDDQGSIRGTLGKKVNIFDCGEEVGRTFIAKMVRAVARALATLAIILFVAPVGTLYHGCLTVAHLGQFMLKGGQKTDHVEKLEAHAKAFFTELTFLCQVFMPIVPTLFSAFSPARMVSLLAWKDERPAIMKAIYLKNDFGIVNSTGNLLNWDVEKDQESQILIRSGQFGDLYCKQGINFLEALSELQKLLPPDNRVPHHYPPSAAVINGFLSNQADSLKEIDINSWQARFTQLENTINYMSSTLKACYEEKSTTIFVENRPNITMPTFPWSDDLCKLYFLLDASIAEPEDKWQAILKKQKEAFQEIEKRMDVKLLANQEKTLSNEFKVYRQRMRDKVDPYSFFGVEEGKIQSTDLNKAWRKAVLTFHPDKIPADYRDLAGVIFVCADEGKKIIEKELENAAA